MSGAHRAFASAAEHIVEEPGEEDLVGDTGFEPVTSAMSTQRSNHLS